MEPIIFGSPSSTGGLGLGIVTTSSNPHYPAYLMGESQSNLSSCIPSGSISPGRRTRQFSSSSAVSSPHSPQVEKESFFPTRIGSKRQGGPPTLSLMGGLPQSPSSRVQSSPFMEKQKIIASTLGASTGYQTPPGSHSTLVNLSPVNQSANYYSPVREISHGTCSDIHMEGQCVEPLDATWVTVYGFPVASASYIITQFAHLGTIVDQRQPGVGNWMHLKYQTKLQARKALSKNSKIFNGNIMVGVVLCTDQSLLEDKENLIDKRVLFSPRESGVLTTPNSMRPLTQAYQASRADIEVTPGSNTPKKNDGLISRAIQHILGI